MIKFFRKLRHSSLMESKFSKYLLYAFGEIILVVIGILIAFQVNSWNTNKTNEKEAYNQLLEVQKEIASNIIEFDQEGDYYFEKHRDLRRVFSDTLPFEAYLAQPNLYNIMNSYSPVEIQNEAFNKLIQNADNLPNAYKPLVLALKNLYNMSSFELPYNRLLNLNPGNNDFSEDFAASLYRSEPDNYIRFIMTSKAYKNRLVTYGITLRDVTNNLLRKKYKALKIHQQMVTLGFPDKNMQQLEQMYMAVNAEVVKPFIGSYTSEEYTIEIRYNTENNKLLVEWLNPTTGEKEEVNNITIQDSATLNMNGTPLEFNIHKGLIFIPLSWKYNNQLKKIRE